MGYGGSRVSDISQRCHRNRTKWGDGPAAPDQVLRDDVPLVQVGSRDQLRPEALTAT